MVRVNIGNESNVAYTGTLVLANLPRTIVTRATQVDIGIINLFGIIVEIVAIAGSNKTTVGGIMTTILDVGIDIRHRSVLRQHIHPAIYVAEGVIRVINTVSIIIHER